MTSGVATQFVLFGTDHILAIAAIAAIAIGLPIAAKYAESAKTERIVALTLAATLVIHELFKITVRVYVYDMPLAGQLPLHLCGIALFLIVYVLVRHSYSVFEVAYFWVLGGTVQAILTPDVPYAFPSLAFVAFFVGHGLTVVGLVYALVVYRFKPTFRSVVKAVIVTLAYLGVIAVVNILLNTNYLYLRHKPQQASLIDYLGPWPWYILSLILVGIVICLVLYLPYAIAAYRAKRLV
ncbi:MAG: TIGR02206 family membrane protein [Gammaproteobacteria bacterium]|nr:TIGR02206 family membrane protein [Gammaproteobacteria bacterium]